MNQGYPPSHFIDKKNPVLGLLSGFEFNKDHFVSGVFAAFTAYLASSCHKKGIFVSKNSPNEPISQKKGVY
jgi:hypothetical protein